MFPALTTIVCRWRKLCITKQEETPVANTVDPVQDLWRSVLATLTTDDRITPQLHGFISLVEPKGVLGGTLYL